MTYLLVSSQAGASTAKQVWVATADLTAQMAHRLEWTPSRLGVQENRVPGPSGYFVAGSAGSRMDIVAVSVRSVLALAMACTSSTCPAGDRCMTADPDRGIAVDQHHPRRAHRSLTLSVISTFLSCEV